MRAEYGFAGDICRARRSASTSLREVAHSRGHEAARIPLEAWEEHLIPGSFARKATGFRDANLSTFCLFIYNETSRSTIKIASANDHMMFSCG